MRNTLVVAGLLGVVAVLSAVEVEDVVVVVVAVVDETRALVAGVPLWTEPDLQHLCWQPENRENEVASRHPPDSYWTVVG